MKNEKQKHKDFIKRKAEKIIELEKQIRLGKDIKSAEQEIQIIMSSLNLEDMFEIDEYIYHKKIFDN